MGRALLRIFLEAGWHRHCRAPWRAEAGQFGVEVPAWRRAASCKRVEGTWHGGRASERRGSPAAAPGERWGDVERSATRARRSRVRAVRGRQLSDA
eukprot:10486415-Alexandrium_andersonii.AAC.1